MLFKWVYHNMWYLNLLQVGPVPQFPSSLDNTSTTARVPLDANRLRRKNRAFQRAMSGLQRHPDQVWRYVFVSMGSADDSPEDIQRSWRKLHERMRRRGMARRYMMVKEVGADTGMLHIHMVVEANWIEQAWLSRVWEEIHGAPVVDVRRCYPKRRGPGGVAGVALELGYYLAKHTVNRMSYSATWGWRRLAGTWADWKRESRRGGISWARTLSLWKWCCLKATPPAQNASVIYSLRHSPDALARLRWPPVSGGGHTWSVRPAHGPSLRATADSRSALEPSPTKLQPRMSL